MRRKCAGKRTKPPGTANGLASKFRNLLETETNVLSHTGAASFTKDEKIYAGSEMRMKGKRTAATINAQKGDSFSEIGGKDHNIDPQKVL